MRKIYLILIFPFLAIQSFAQPSDGDYQTNPASPPNMNWETAGDWQIYNGGWITATVSPTSGNANIITVRNGHNVTINNNITIDQTTIENTGTLTINGGVTVIVRNGPGRDLTNNGTIILSDLFGFVGSTLSINRRFLNTGTVTINSPLISFVNVNDNAIYEHGRDGGAIPTGNWASTSTCEISGTTVTVPTGLDQSFGNLDWNTPGMVGLINLALGTSTSTQGNFTVSNTGGPASILAFTSTETGSILNINGNLSITGSSQVAFTATGSITINVNADFIKTSTGPCFFVNTGTANLNVNGNVSHTSGALGNSGGGTANLNFSGTTLQTYTGGGSIIGPINYNINSNAIVDLGTSSLIGSGSFTLNTNGTLRIGNAEGIEASTTSGAIQVPLANRTYNSGGTVVYNGSGSQNMGNDPGIYTSGLNITTNKPSGDLFMESNLTIDNFRNLVLTSGNLIIGSNTLTINGTISGGGSLTASAAIPATANLAIGGTGSMGTINFTSGNNYINNFNYSSGNTILGSDLNVSGTFTHTGGNLDFSSQTLTIAGIYNNVGGTFLSSTTSALFITGSGTINTLNMQSGSDLDILEIDRTGVSVNTASTFTVADLRILAGTFSASSSMTISSGGSITRNGNGTLTNIPGGTNSYNVTYIGTLPSYATGNELPNLATRLLNLTNNSGSTINLSKNITVNGDLILNGGILSAGTRSITMNGANWTVNNGTFTGGTGTVNFNGTTTIGGTSSNYNFNNMVLSTSANISFPAAYDVSLAGSITVPNLATISVQPLSFLFEGGANQAVSFNGKNINAIKVDKTAGDVTLQSGLNLTEKLEILSATVFNSQGNLTLISTSAGTTGNAYIAALPAGASVDGDVIVQRLVDAEGRPVWRHISSPVSGAIVDDLTPYFLTIPAQGVYTYDETLPGTLDERWNKETLSSPMTPGVGFIAAAFNSSTNLNWEMTGPVNQGTFDFIPTKSGNTADDGWNFSGNPYPSTIDWDRPGWTKRQMGNTMYVRDYVNGVYLFWNGNPATSTKNNGLIATGQGFWFTANNGANKLLQFTEEVKSTSTGTFYRMAQPEIENLLAAGITNGNISDKVFILFNENGTDNYDEEFDSRKLNNAIFNISTLSADNFNLCVDYKPMLEQRKSVFLNVYNFTAGTYTLFFEHIESINTEYSIILIDHYTGEDYDLRDVNEIEFMADPDIPSTFGADRFEVVFARDFDPDNLSHPNDLIVYPNPAKDWITIRLKDTKENNFEDDPKYNIFDPSTGLVLLKGELKEAQNHHYIAKENVSFLEKGLYIVQVEAGDQNYYSKLSIH